MFRVRRLFVLGALLLSFTQRFSGKRIHLSNRIISLHLSLVLFMLTSFGVTMGKLLKGGMIGGIVLFVWSIVSWGVLSWHIDSLQSFDDEKKMTMVIEENVKKPGVYFLPMAQLPTISSFDMQFGELLSIQANKQPLMFASILPNGLQESSAKTWLLALAAQMVAAFLVTSLVLINTCARFWGRFGQVMLFAIAASIVTHVPYFTWFHFPLTFILVEVVDLLVAWALAGIVIASVTKPKYPNFR